MKKWIVIFSLGCLALILFAVFRTEPSSKHPHKLAICAMFKDEAPWLKEWIEYHRILGATKFYLYDNDSSDGYKEVLSPYIEKGIVELIDWNSSEEHAIRGIEDVAFIPYQLGAFNDCLKNRALGQAEWVAVIDIDEFIVPVKGKKAFISLLEKSARSDVGTLRMNWRIYGTSHVQSLAPGELLTEKLVKRALDNHPWNGNVKSIHRPEAVEFCAVHEARHLREGFKVRHLKNRDFRINHYWTRSENELAKKRKLSPQEAEKFRDEFNVMDDRTIFQYLPLLKKNFSDIR